MGFFVLATLIVLCLAIGALPEPPEPPSYRYEASGTIEDPVRVETIEMRYEGRVIGSAEVVTLYERRT